ncbi:Uncharacterised protein [Citrobacter freundii]|nr:Uncharacterised protein [Citrobacter freundii]
MTLLRYTLHDARRWAAFSGDYNPMHFDNNWVKTHGIKGLSIHGMRALLDVKCFVSPCVSDSPYLKCTIRLRKPLWHDTTYDMVRDGKKEGSAIVNDISSGSSCFSCHITPVKNLPFTPDCVSKYELQRDTFASLQKAFIPFQSNIQLWHYLDAILFRHLIQDRTLLHQEAFATILSSCSNLEELFICYPILQTHQEIIFDSHLLSQLSSESSPELLVIETLPALVIGDLQLGVIASVTVRTHYQNYAISNTVTLKIGPMSIK